MVVITKCLLSDDSYYSYGSEGYVAVPYVTGATSFVSSVSVGQSFEDNLLSSKFVESTYSLTSKPSKLPFSV